MPIKTTSATAVLLFASVTACTEHLMTACEVDEDWGGTICVP